MRSGYLRLGAIRGVAVRVHWTLPIMAVLLGGFRFAPYAYATVIALVLLHEIGHAILVKIGGMHLRAIEIDGLGGSCRWSGAASPRTRAVIAWGGVAAQLLALAATSIWLYRHGEPSSPAGVQIVRALTRSNAWMIALSLLPVPPLDGAEAWKLFRRVHVPSSTQALPLDGLSALPATPGSNVPTLDEELARLDVIAREQRVSAEADALVDEVVANAPLMLPRVRRG